MSQRGIYTYSTCESRQNRHPPTFTLTSLFTNIHSGSFNWDDTGLQYLKIYLLPLSSTSVVQYRQKSPYLKECGNRAPASSECFVNFVILFYFPSKASMAQNPQAPGGFTGDRKIDIALDIVEGIERARRVAPRDPPSENFGQPYQEIKSLVWAKHNPVYSVALGEWERKERLFSARVERREKSSADLINQIFNLVGFFSGFQGLVLTAVTQLVSASSCKSQCRKVWFPILLTVVAAFVTVVGVLQKFRAHKELQDSIKIEKQAQAVRALITILPPK